MFTKNFDEKFSKKKKIFFPRNFPKIFSKKSNVLFPRKVTFCSRESIILFHAKFSRRMNFMLRITFSMENCSRGHAKTILKNVSFCSRESNILLPRKVTFCSRKSIILFYAKSLDLVTKNLFTKYKYIEIVHQKLWKKNYGFGYIKFFHHFWLQRIFSPNMVTMNLFTVQRHLLVWKKNFFLVEMS